MYCESQDHLQSSERDAALAGSSGNTRINRGKLVGSQNPNVVAPTTNPEISLEKTSALNNTLDLGPS